MNVHRNACLTPKGRGVMVRAVTVHGFSKAAALAPHFAELYGAAALVGETAPSTVTEMAQ